MSEKHPKPGMTWRFLAHKRPGRAYTDPVKLSHKDFDEPVEFDELVVGDWFHMEQMGHRHWWFQVGGHHFNVTIPTRGPVRVTWQESEDGGLHAVFGPDDWPRPLSFGFKLQEPPAPEVVEGEGMRR